MKNIKHILVPIFIFLLSANINAQKHDKEKINALKVAHITEELDLTAKEAQAFWPIYNHKEEAEDNIRENSGLKRINDFDAISETEAKDYLDTLIKMELSKQKIQKEYYTKLKNVLSAKKILKLMNAERSFRRKMIQEFKQRHRGKSKK
ncbi:hypothetical protein [Lacinutrix sp. MedPE-SW]|uniref:hypothetical protein n=1 Tax=Lacinutrix sp. MedPE-SW TaxID=1860087 RepID=UPI000922312E|nr:hypothetical protein [Lacinutrix sp. MedPE-SW]OIQ22929.1 MAG: hypothetical protein BM549_05250 [Lacinutrix sp. MedPE-SW]